MLATRVSATLDMATEHPGSAGMILSHGRLERPESTLQRASRACSRPEMNILQALMDHSEFRAKIIQVELNHYIVPPMSYKDMCHTYTRAPGRSGGSEHWGCSMQAAYDVLRPHGYALLQYDWPDGVFILGPHARAFPGIPTGDAHYMRNFWIGYVHARDRYSRFPLFAWNLTRSYEYPAFASRARFEPRSAMEAVLRHEKGHLLRKKGSSQIEMGVTGTGVSLIVLKPNASRKSGLTVRWQPNPQSSSAPAWMEPPPLAPQPTPSALASMARERKARLWKYATFAPGQPPRNSTG